MNLRQELIRSGKKHCYYFKREDKVISKLFTVDKLTNNQINNKVKKVAQSLKINKDEIQLDYAVLNFGIDYMEKPYISYVEGFM